MPVKVHNLEDLIDVPDEQIKRAKVGHKDGKMILTVQHSGQYECPFCDHEAESIEERNEHRKSHKVVTYREGETTKREVK